MQIKELIKNNKVVLILHTLIVLYAVLASLIYIGEGAGSGWFLIFVVDFPVSIICLLPYEWFNESMANSSVYDNKIIENTWFFLSHTILGGLWWVVIVNTIKKIFGK